MSNQKPSYRVTNPKIILFAHAWVKYDEKLVMDSEDLMKGLSIILNESFRKLKI